MGANGEPYQKYDGDTGRDEPVNADTYGSSDGTTANGVGGAGKKWFKWLAPPALIAVVGVLYGVTQTGVVDTTYLTAAASMTESPVATSDGNTMKEALADSALNVKANGQIKLFDEHNRYVMEDYDAKSTFSSFLPGVAGYFGKPVWAFYVNRGQGIATFGEESKDYPILEFNPANKAYQLTAWVGFRTFIQGERNGRPFLSEVFDSDSSRNLELKDDTANANRPKRIMYVGTNEMEIQEIDATNGLTTNVQYFVLPEEDFAALVRRTTIANHGKTPVTISVLDGLSKMEPFGGPLDGGLKSMGRTLEGWMGVYHADDTLHLPFYKLSTEPSDTASVKIEEAGHYCIAFIEHAEQQASLLPIVYDSSKVFGKDTALNQPRGLKASSVSSIVANAQYGWAKTSSAFAAVQNVTLAPGENITIASIYGKAENIEIVPMLASHVTTPGFVANKFQRARAMINELTEGVETSTVNPLFDGTVRQMFLDNGLRGGFPTILGNVNDDTTYDDDSSVKVFHSFSRIHGDLERDYNAFNIQPTFFSQGPGNYRDIAQNRRNDVTFFPRMASFDIQMFLSYVQADGYEPLTVEAVVFRFEDEDMAKEIAMNITNDDKSGEVLGNVLIGGAFRPGQLFELCERLSINLAVTKEVFINEILKGATDRAMAVYGQGYWADHWDYYIDMIEAYLAVFPDGEESLMYDKPLRYFFSTATVKPRSQKYVLTLTYDGKDHHVLQLDSTFFDQDKAAEQEAFRSANTGLLGIEASWQRTADGEPFMSSAIAKLFLLGSLKFAMRDAWGMGVEYEGGRPGWLDSMNGLPGMLGSGMPETYELYLLLKYVKRVCDTYGRSFDVPTELYNMTTIVNKQLHKLKSSGYSDSKHLPLKVPKPLFEYWDNVASAREDYRNNVQYYFSGNTTTIKAKEVSEMISTWLKEIEVGIERSFYFATEGYGDDGDSGVPPCFFAYEVTDWVKNGRKNDVGLPLVNAKALKLKTFPLFLEGPVRYMKTIQDNQDKMMDMYERVKKTGLRDTFLNMYFLSSSLKGQSYDMGRQMSFAPGWLENQSIWVHMSYKYYLQLIRGKLYDQFFAEMKGGGILPFMDPIVYGRSLMECSSFIASSAFPDPSIVGEGFLARLSGSTAEFMDMWKNMFLGPQMFFLNKHGDVEMQLQPVLPAWLFEDPDSDNDPTFDDKGNHVVSFKLFASIPVTYHNPGGGNLYAVNPKKYVVTKAEGETLRIDGPTIPTKTALEIRRVTNIKWIDAYF